MYVRARFHGYVIWGVRRHAHGYVIMVLNGSRDQIRVVIVSIYTPGGYNIYCEVSHRRRKKTAKNPKNKQTNKQSNKQTNKATHKSINI